MRINRTSLHPRPSNSVVPLVNALSIVAACIALWQVESDNTIAILAQNRTADIPPQIGKIFLPGAFLQG